MFALLKDAIDGVRKKKTATKLTNLKVANISAVARPANRRRWLVMKADGSVTETTPPQTFDDAMLGRRLQHVYAGLAEHYAALMETLDSIRTSREADKSDAITTALNEFLASLKAAVPRIIARLEDEDADSSELTKSAMMRLQKLQDTIGELIANAEVGEDEGGEDDMGTKQVDWSKVDFEAVTKKILDDAVAAFRKSVTTTEKAAKKTPVDELADLVRAAIDAHPGLTRELIVVDVLMQNADLARRLKAFVQAQDGGHEQALLEVYQRATASFGTDVRGQNVSKGGAAAELDRRARSRMAKGTGSESYLDALNAESIAGPALEQAARQQSTYATSGGTLADRATTLEKSGAGSAAAEADQKISALLSKSDKLDYAAALRQVFAENPGLYDRYRAEFVGV